MFLFITAASIGILSQTAAKPIALTTSSDLKQEEIDQEILMKPSQAKTRDYSPGSMMKNEDPVDTKLAPLPQRVGARPKTTGTVPHQQIGVKAVPDLNDSLFSLVFSLPDVERHNSISSLPGATGVWLKKETAIAQPQVILAGREFTHIHPDGSLHTPLPFARALEAVEKGWAERHPWASERAGWDGLVMLYTPQSEADLEIVFQLIVESYNFVTGQSEIATEHKK